MIFDEQYARYRQMAEDALVAALDACGAPEPLLSAMRYSALAGGKRLRPVLLLAACEMGGTDAREALPYACAMEMIHTYSLIHDDLPAMDDDDLRRGKPTNHKVFGEGMAVLAGDGLLSLAFEVMLGAAKDARGIAAMRCVAEAAGTHGMVAGQCVDIRCEAERCGGAQELLYIHRRKTAMLFMGAVGAGLSVAGVEGAKAAAGARFAEALGIAFQIRDDLLDIKGDARALGKQTGKDGARGKLTWPSVHGVPGAQEALGAYTQEALSQLEAFGDAAFLASLTNRLLSRDR